MGMPSELITGGPRKGRGELPMPTFIPSFGPFERPLSLQGVSVAKPSSKRQSSPKPKRPPRPPAPTLPPMPPVYVIVYTHSIWAGAGPVVSSSLSLSAAAIAAGCTIEKTINADNFEFGEYIGENVIKMPVPVAGNVFTLTLAGTSYESSPDPDPTQFCGHYFGTATLVLDHVIPIFFEGIHVTDAGLWTFSWSATDPDGSQSKVVPNILGSTNPAEPPFLISSYIFDFTRVSYYDPITGNLVTTNFPCGGPPLPTFGTLPFEVAIYVNPVEGHTVNDPGWPYDPVDVVRTIENYGGQTQVWGWSVNHNALDGVTTFAMGYRPVSTVLQDRFVEVWPSSAIHGAKTYDAFGPYIRRIIPPPSHTVFMPREFPWNADVRISLRTGTPPPLVTFDPFA